MYNNFMYISDNMQKEREKWESSTKQNIFNNFKKKNMTDAYSMYQKDKKA